MEHKIDDYLHLYLGCDIVCDKDPNLVAKLVGVATTARLCNLYDGKKYYAFETGRVQLLLTRIEDMSQDEKKEYFKQVHQFNTGNLSSHLTTDYAYRVLWLLRNGFDIFNLIDKKFAVDKIKFKDEHPFERPSE